MEPTPAQEHSHATRKHCSQELGRQYDFIKLRGGDGGLAVIRNLLASPAEALTMWLGAKLPVSQNAYFLFRKVAVARLSPENCPRDRCAGSTW